MKIVGLGGSLRSHSFTYQLLEYTLSKISQKGIETDLIDLRHLHLPFCSGDSHYIDYPDVMQLRQRVQSASGLILATPEYHGGLSGVLKNALDLLEVDDVKGKVAGLLSIVGGMHSTNALNALRLICRHMHCWVLPDQFVISSFQVQFDLDGHLTAPFEARLEQLINHLIESSYKLGK